MYDGPWHAQALAQETSLDGFDGDFRSIDLLGGHRELAVVFFMFAIGLSTSRRRRFVFLLMLVLMTSTFIGRVSRFGS